MAEAQGFDPEAVKIPIVIGVAGHRDAIENERGDLSRAIRAALLALIEAHPGSRFILMSSLAEGADQLVAKIGLQEAEKRKDCRIDLVVPLPMPQEEYERDFTSAESLEQFGQLIDKADWFVLPWVGNNTPENIADENRRYEQYLARGRYISRHSHILLALWDGDTGPRAGGTAEAVSLTRTGKPHREELHDSIREPCGIGPVYHISTPRRSNPEPSGEPYTLEVLYPDSYDKSLDSKAMYNAIIGEIAEFNRDVDAMSQQNRDEAEQGGNDLVIDFQNLIDNPLVERTASRCSAASVLATKYKKKHYWAVLYLVLLATLSYVFLEVYDEILTGFSWGWVALLGFPLLLLAAWLMLKGSAIAHGKFLGYRALAEGMRVQFYWLTLGASWRVADCYLDKHRGELQWVRWAILAWLIPEGRPGKLQVELKSEDRLRAFSLLQQYWIDGQGKYFAGKLGKLGRAIKLSERWRGGLFGLALLLSVILIAVHIILYATGSSAALISFVQSLFILVIALSFVIGGALSHYAEKQTYTEELQQYYLARVRFNAVYTHLEQAMKHLEQATKHPEAMKRPEQADGNEDYDAALEAARRLLEEIGQEALWENADWVLLHKQRPPGIHAA